MAPFGSRMSIFRKENFLVLNEKVFHFENKIVFGCIKNFLLENKKLFRMRKNGVENCLLREYFKKIRFLLQKDIVQKKFENEIFFKLRE